MIPKGSAITPKVPRYPRQGYRRYDVAADLGCSLYPSCLTCPRPLCRYDDPMSSRHEHRVTNMEEAHRLRLQGIGATEIANRMGVGRRTVYRWICDYPNA